jgi:ketosteroid isomerase-like protein
MTMENGRALEEARIRTAIVDRAKALRARNGLEGSLFSFRGPVGCEVHDLSITADDDMAIGHSLLRISGPRSDGHDIDVWTPATFCLRKIDGAWEVTDEQTPVPLDVDRGAGSFDRLN